MSTPSIATGVELIGAERQRQAEREGWSAANDDRHESGELAFSAAAYALWDTEERESAQELEGRGACFPLKPKGHLRNLVRAGALIAAEIDRVLRTGE